MALLTFRELWHGLLDRVGGTVVRFGWYGFDESVVRSLSRIGLK